MAYVETMHRALSVALVALVACAHSHVRQFTGEDGSPNWWHVSCPGDDAECLARAGERCPAGYDVHGRGVDGRVTRSEKIDGADVTTVHRGKGELTIRCKGKPAPVPTMDPDCNTSNPRLFKCDEQEEAVREAGMQPPF